MRTAQELRELLRRAQPPDNMASGVLYREMAEDLIARREADEAKAVDAEAEALRARVFAECTVANWTRGNPENDAVTLTHKPTGLSAAAPRRDTALDSLIVQLRAAGALPTRAVLGD